MVKALTIISRLPGLDTELQRKEDWQRRGVRLCHVLSISGVSSFHRKKKQQQKKKRRKH